MGPGHGLRGYGQESSRTLNIFNGHGFYTGNSPTVCIHGLHHRCYYRLPLQAISQQCPGTGFPAWALSRYQCSRREMSCNHSGGPYHRRLPVRGLPLHPRRRTCIRRVNARMHTRVGEPQKVSDHCTRMRGVHPLRARGHTSHVPTAAIRTGSNEPHEAHGCSTLTGMPPIYPPNERNFFMPRDPALTGCTPWVIRIRRNPGRNPVTS